MLAALLAFAAAAPARGAGPARPVYAADAERSMRALYQQIGIDQNLGAQVPLDLPLRDEKGRSIRFGDLLGTRPVILNLVYYECPMLCNEVLNSLLRSLNALSFEVGKEFEVITVSIDPTEAPALAARKKAAYVARYHRPGAAAGWHFLTGDAGAVKRLAEVVGFRYVYDPKTRQYAHAAGIMVLTPGGRVSRYVLGISYLTRDLQFALMDASARKIGTPMDRVLLLCFHYDPRTGKYNFAIMTIARVLGLATLAGLGGSIAVMLRRDRRASPPAPGPLPQPQHVS